MNSYTYLKEGGVFTLAIEEIEPPVRDPGIKGYRSEQNYARLKDAMLADEIIEPIEVRSKKKSKTEKYQVYDGYHRFHLSVELGYKCIPVRINDWDMKEFLEKNG